MNFKSLKKQGFYKILYKACFYIICLTYIFVAFCFVFDSGKRIFVYPLKHKDEICYYCETYGIEKALIFAMVKTESGFNEKAESKKGAKGLMQLTDKTAAYVADLRKIEEYDVFDIETNLDFGCFYYKYLANKFYDRFTAVAAYNAGEGTVRLWLQNPQYSEDKVILSEIPYPETKAYVNKIKKSFENYKKLYGNILDK